MTDSDGGWKTARRLVRAVLDAPGEEEREKARAAAFDFLRTSDKKHLLSLAHLLQPGATLRAVQAAIVPLERHDRRARIADDEILVRDTDAPDAPRRPAPFTVVADNIRSAFNAGGLFRTADFFGAEKLVLCGYTPGPDNPQVAKTSLGADEAVPWSRAADVRDAIDELKKNGAAVYALETADRAESAFTFEPRWPCALVLGNERFGLDSDVLAMADGVVEIPSFGRKNSLNVVSAFAVAAAFLRARYSSGAISAIDAQSAPAPGCGDKA